VRLGGLVVFVLTVDDVSSPSSTRRQRATMSKRGSLEPQETRPFLFPPFMNFANARKQNHVFRISGVGVDHSAALTVPAYLPKHIAFVLILIL